MNFQDRNIPPCAVVIFGASGDLTRRKLVPALHSLDCRGLLPENLSILGVSRSEFSDDEFRQHLKSGVKEFGELNPEMWEELAARIAYLQADYDDDSTYARLRDRLEAMGADGANRMFYLSVPPPVFSTIIRWLGESGLNHSEEGWARVVVEKPFGEDLKSAQDLNKLLYRTFDEEQIYRIDHFLGKETVQNLLAFRFANFLFESVWQRSFVDHVQITVLESVGVGERAGYYDSTGVIRDMLQNHLLQLLALTAMDPPVSLSAKTLRDEKVKALQSVQPFAMQDVILGQYEGYRQEEGVAEDSNIPTYVAIKLKVENWRWHGVPFYLRTGKSLTRKATEIVLQFKGAPCTLFRLEGDSTPNMLSICIQPDEGMHLGFDLKVPGSDGRTAPVEMEFHYNELFEQRDLPDAYERLLLDIMLGDASLFTRSDEIELAWEIVSPILEQDAARDSPPLHFYSPGTEGPAEAEELIAGNGAWALCCKHEETPERE